MPVSHARTDPTSTDGDLVGLADAIELYQLFTQVADPRKPRGIRHGVATVLTVTVFAALAGAKNFREAGDRAADLPSVLLEAAGARYDRRAGRRKAPSGSTLRRVIEDIDGDACDLLVCRWMAERAARLADSGAPEGEPRLFGVAVDGKTVRNSGAGDPRANVKLFSAMLHDEAIVVAQIRVPDGTTEVTQVKALLDPVDLAGAVVTGDAAHTQHYVSTVKNNQPSLRAAISAEVTTIGEGCGHHLEEDRSHGRMVRRQIWICPAGSVDFPGAAQVFRIRRDVFNTSGDRVSKEVVHGVTSLGAGQSCAKAVAAWVRRHWGIENRIHWVRDVPFAEDGQHSYLGASAQVMTTIRNLAIGLVRLAGHAEIKRTLESLAAERTRILPLLAASRP